MTKRRRTYNLGLIKATLPYSVNEITELLGVHKNTVSQWFEDGLRVNQDKRPWIVRGDELKCFLGARQNSRKKKCRLTEFYCLKCHDRREAYLNIADIIFESPTKLRLKVICAVCSTRMNKVQNTNNLEKIQAAFNIQKLEGEHIIECIDPSLNSDNGETK